MPQLKANKNSILQTANTQHTLKGLSKKRNNPYTKAAASFLPVIAVSNALQEEPFKKQKSTLKRFNAVYNLHQSNNIYCYKLKVFSYKAFYPLESLPAELLKY